MKQAEAFATTETLHPVTVNITQDSETKELFVYNSNTSDVHAKIAELFGMESQKPKRTYKRAAKNIFGNEDKPEVKAKRAYHRRAKTVKADTNHKDARELVAA